MRVDITGRHVVITPGLRQLLEQSLAKIERLLGDSVVSATVVLAKQKYLNQTELIIHAKGDHTLSGLGEGNTWPLSVRKAAAKIEHQAQKLKSRWTEGKRQRSNNREVAADAGTAGTAGTAAPGRAAAGAPGPRASAAGRPPARAARAGLKPKRYAVKAMSLDDATQRLDAVSEAFVIFRNADTNAISVLFRRTDGKLGLIEPD